MKNTLLIFFMILPIIGFTQQKKTATNFEALFAKIYPNLLYKPFPRFVMNDWHGNYWTTESLIGKPSFIRISKRDCLPCKIELSYFIELADSIKDCHFVYLTPDDTNAIDNRLKKDANIIVIPNCRAEILAKYGINSGYPTSIFTDSYGTIQTGWVGGRVQYARESKIEWSILLRQLLH